MTKPLPLLDLDLLRTLVAIADSGSFSAAANQVGRTPSAVSMQVKKVEETLGRPVFLRDSRSVQLTGDGVFLVEHGRQMLSLNRAAMERFVTPEVEGVVRLGAPDEAAERFLPGMLERFAETHPGVTVDVVVDTSHRMVEFLREGKLDLTLLTCRAVIAEEPQAEILFHEQLIWCMRRGGLAPTRTPLPLSVWQAGCAWRDCAVEALAEQNRPWRLAFQSSHISGQRAAIIADLAVAPIPKSNLSDEIVEVPRKFGLPKLPQYGLALLVSDDVNPAIQAAAGHVRRAFSTVKTGAA
ncbi:MAG: LysR substrate-binding domain-containing protein [Pseudomonadota bacterium]